jgi:hypothetical protein
VMMRNGLHASIHSFGTVDLKVTSGRMMQPKNVQHVSSINKNLVSDSLLRRVSEITEESTMMCGR